MSQVVDYLLLYIAIMHQENEYPSQTDRKEKNIPEGRSTAPVFPGSTQMSLWMGVFKSSTFQLITQLLSCETHFNCIKALPGHKLTGPKLSPINTQDNQYKMFSLSYLTILFLSNNDNKYIP